MSWDRWTLWPSARATIGYLVYKGYEQKLIFQHVMNIMKQVTFFVKITVGVGIRVSVRLNC